MSAGAALAVAGALWAAPALGDATITAGPAPNTFATTDLTIDQGQTITFQNSDQTAIHDVTSDQTGRDGHALFESDTTEPGKTAPVKRVEFLTTGDYAFHCSIHPFMKGTLHVTANGTPKLHTPDNPGRNPNDTVPPHASVAIRDSRISGVLFHRGVRLRLKTNEPARFKLTASSGKTQIALGTFVVKTAKRDVKISLTKKGKQLLFRANSAKLKLAAKVNDAADNRATASATRTLR
ncbi:MAG TPA: cupredoxin domain-containing protein [Thermoleophilaceae bacterium]|nr:cupredoxin domain-containing protein [Thermoleophilaceae bacterium]